MARDYSNKRSASDKTQDANKRGKREEYDSSNDDDDDVSKQNYIDSNLVNNNSTEENAIDNGKSIRSHQLCLLYIHAKVRLLNISMSIAFIQGNNHSITRSNQHRLLTNRTTSLTSQPNQHRLLTNRTTSLTLNKTSK